MGRSSGTTRPRAWAIAGPIPCRRGAAFGSCSARRIRISTSLTRPGNSSSATPSVDMETLGGFPNLSSEPRSHDVGLHGVVGRIQRSAHRHGPFEPDSDASIGTIAPGAQDDGALLLLGTVAGRARSVVAGGGIPLPLELAGLRVASLEREAARAGQARGAVFGRKAFQYGRDIGPAGYGGVACNLRRAVFIAFIHAVLDVRRNPWAGPAPGLPELGGGPPGNGFHRGITFVETGHLCGPVVEAAVLAVALAIEDRILCLRLVAGCDPLGASVVDGGRGVAAANVGSCQRHRCRGIHRRCGKVGLVAAVVRV